MNWFIGHLIGDFLLQSDWLAREKKNMFFVAMIHAAIWTLSVMLCTGWVFRPHASTVTIVLLFTHALQDHTNIVVRFMRWKGSSEFMRAPLGPWSIIVTDNCLHLVLLWIVSIILAH